MLCAVCGNTIIHGSHVKDKSSFKQGEKDRWLNIISLCPLCHAQFDAEPGTIAICPDKKSFLILDGGKVTKVISRQNICHVKDEYIRFKNENCALALKLALGLILGYTNKTYVRF